MRTPLLATPVAGSHLEEDMLMTELDTTERRASSRPRRGPDRTRRLWGPRLVVAATIVTIGIGLAPPAPAPEPEAPRTAAEAAAIVVP